MSNQSLADVRDFLTKRPLIPSIRAEDLPMTDYRHERDYFLESLYRPQRDLRCPKCKTQHEEYTWENLPLEVTEIECDICDIHYKIVRKHDLNFAIYCLEEE